MILVGGAVRHATAAVSSNMSRSGCGGDQPEAKYCCPHAHPDSRARIVRTSFGLSALVARSNVAEGLADCARYYRSSRGAVGTAPRAGRFQPRTSALDQGTIRFETRTAGAMEAGGARPSLSKD